MRADIGSSTDACRGVEGAQATLQIESEKNSQPNGEGIVIDAVPGCPGVFDVLRRAPDYRTVRPCQFQFYIRAQMEENRQIRPVFIDGSIAEVQGEVQAVVEGKIEQGLPIVQEKKRQSRP